MTVTILYLADAERRALDRLLQVDAVRIGAAITHADGADDLQATIERAGEHLALMRAYERGHLSLDDAILRRLHTRHEEILAEIAHEQRCLRDPTVGWLGLTPEQSAEKTRVEIDRLLDEADGIDSVRCRGGAPEVGTAA
jgi:hypothetical protein